MPKTGVVGMRDSRVPERWNLALVRKVLVRGLVGVSSSIALYFILAGLLCLVTVNSEFTAGHQGVTIFVHTNGLHCDVVVPVRTPAVNWFEKLPVSDFEKVDETFRYVSFGWGDRSFYLDTPTWHDLRVSTALKALFFMGTSALHVGYYLNEPVQDGHCVRLTVTAAEYGHMVDQICGSFQVDDSGRFKPIPRPGYGPCDKFYEARGTYSVFQTCNVWVGSVLKSGHIKVGLWTPFDWGIMHSIR